MIREFVNIRELRAKYLTEPVTLAYCDAEDGLNSKAVEDFNPFGDQCMSAAQIVSYRYPKEDDMASFYRVDSMMDFYTSGPHEVIIVYPLQGIMQDPYDADEIEALHGIAKGWAEQTGAKIVLLLDTHTK